MRKIVLAFDSFKGSLSATEVARIAADELSKGIDGCQLCSIPISDGGEGMVDALIAATGGRKITVRVHDPLMRPMDAYYGCSQDGTTAFIEMASASGLPLLKIAERNPLETTTFGTGEMVAHAIELGCREIVLGIGGSATNDAGMGMLSALGYRFFDSQGVTLRGCGADLERIAGVDTQNVLPLLNQTSFRVACDVANPFYGPNGAAHVFAAQKGATAHCIEALDRGMKHTAEIFSKVTGVDVQQIQGSGAAGGMGGGAVAFLNAQLQKGIELIFGYLKFESLVDGADHILTGEGMSDRQTLMGKAPFGVLQMAQKMGIPVALFAGRIEDAPLLTLAGFTSIYEVSPRDIPLEIAMTAPVAEANLRAAVKRFIQKEKTHGQ